MRMEQLVDWVHCAKMPMSSNYVGFHASMSPQPENAELPLFKCDYDATNTFSLTEILKVSFTFLSANIF